MTTELGATSVIVAAMPLKECIKLPGIKDGSLFQKNVRQSLGINNTVNKKIKKTINDPNKCGDFFFFIMESLPFVTKLKNVAMVSLNFMD